nr:MAG TPA: 4Fe-4S binding domain protein [Caudoviricetes sp.]
MSLTCVNKVKTCTGCMACQDEFHTAEEEIISEDERKAAYEILDIAKAAFMVTYGIKDYQAVDLMRDYVYAQ